MLSDHPVFPILLSRDLDATRAFYHGVFGAASAATTTTIRIDVNEFNGTETFTTTGGALCPSGWAETFDLAFAGGPRTGTFHLKKTLHCDDGSGTFTIGVQAKVIFGAPTDNGGWWVVDGTDDYAGLHGTGSLLGTYTDTGIIDLYSGKVTR